MRVASIGALVFVLAACGSSGSRATDQSVPENPQLVAPLDLPDGWYVTSASAEPVDLRPLQSLYARPGSDPARDPALLVADGDEMDDLAIPPADTEPLDDFSPGGAAARIGHFGDYTMVMWARYPDASTFVMGRGLDDDAVLAAARAARFGEGAPRILADALQEGFDLLGSAPVLPQEGGASEQRISLSDEHRHNVRLAMSDLDASATRVAVFLAGFPGKYPEESGRGGTVRGRMFFARGLASAETVDAIAQAVVPVTDGEWHTFRRRVLDVPAPVLLAGCPTLRGNVVIAGVEGDVRWGVVIPPPDAERPCYGTARFEVDGMLNAPGGQAGRVDPYAAAPGSFGISVLAGEGYSAGLSDSSETLGGTVPADTERVVVAGGTRTTNATLADAPPGSPRDRRYFGAYVALPSVGAKVSATAYAADGRVVGRYASG